jgi:hypothetical protein
MSVAELHDDRPARPEPRVPRLPQPFKLLRGVEDADHAVAWGGRTQHASYVLAALDPVETSARASQQVRIWPQADCLLSGERPSKADAVVKSVYPQAATRIRRNRGASSGQ